MLRFILFLSFFTIFAWLEPAHAVTSIIITCPDGPPGGTCGSTENICLGTSCPSGSGQVVPSGSVLGNKTDGIRSCQSGDVITGACNTHIQTNTNPNSNFPDPQAPSTVTPTTGVSVSGTVYATAQIACDTVAASYTGIYQGTTCYSVTQPNPPNYNLNMYHPNYGQFGYATGTPANSCPSGYTESGGSCNLTNPSAAQRPSDGVCEILRTGNSYAPDPNDPDCTGNGATYPNSSTVCVGPLNDRTCSTINPTTGATTVTHSGDNGNGTTHNDTVNISPPDANGDTSVDGTASGNTSGTGDAATTNPAPAKDPCGLPDTAPCKIDETGTPTATTDQFDNKIDGTGIQGLIDGASTVNQTSTTLNPSVLIPDGLACQSITLSYRGTSVQIPGSSGCQKMETFKQYFGYLLYVLTGFTMLTIATRSPA